jgi:peptidoglycan/xylan/chitin deacetylase (PgdA/CDA1 family)
MTSTTRRRGDIWPPHQPLEITQILSSHFLVSTVRAAGALAALAFASSALADEACLYRPTPQAGLVSAESVADYRSTLLSCHRADSADMVAIRSMTIDKTPMLLLADPQRLSTWIERAACWTCKEASEGELARTRYLRGVAEAAATPGVVHRTFLQNAGLIHGAGPGAYVTGDLCPSRKPLDRRFFEELMSSGPRAPVALGLSGLWLVHHADDFHWLLGKQAEGALDIIWTNHSYHHPYAKGRPDDQTFMLTKDLDVDYEILETERLLIANGGVPSVFFRFPGLVSNSPLMDAVRRHHLIVIGTDAWLAKGQRAVEGSILLVHPNGNEEGGIDRFARLYDRGTIPRPLEPVAAAPR